MQSHEDITIIMPSSNPPPSCIDISQAVHTYFDGGSTQNLGSGSSALIFLLNGRLLISGGYYHTYSTETNNTAEARGMVDCLKLIEGIEWDQVYSGVVVHGDSSLCTSFM